MATTRVETKNSSSPTIVLRARSTAAASAAVAAATIDTAASLAHSTVNTASTVVAEAAATHYESSAAAVAKPSNKPQNNWLKEWTRLKQEVLALLSSPAYKFKQEDYEALLGKIEKYKILFDQKIQKLNQKVNHFKFKIQDTLSAENLKLLGQYGSHAEDIQDNEIKLEKIRFSCHETRKRLLALRQEAMKTNLVLGILLSDQDKEYFSNITPEQLEAENVNTTRKFYDQFQPTYSTLLDGIMPEAAEMAQVCRSFEDADRCLNLGNLKEKIAFLIACLTNKEKVVVDLKEVLQKVKRDREAFLRQENQALISQIPQLENRYKDLLAQINKIITDHTTLQSIMMAVEAEKLAADSSRTALLSPNWQTQYQSYIAQPITTLTSVLHQNMKSFFSKINYLDPEDPFSGSTISKRG